MVLKELLRLALLVVDNLLKLLLFSDLLCQELLLQRVLHKLGNACQSLLTSLLFLLLQVGHLGDLSCKLCILILLKLTVREQFL